MLEPRPSTGTLGGGKLQKRRSAGRQKTSRMIVSFQVGGANYMLETDPLVCGCDAVPTVLRPDTSASKNLLVIMLRLTRQRIAKIMLQRIRIQFENTAATVQFKHGLNKAVLEIQLLDPVESVSSTNRAARASHASSIASNSIMALNIGAPQMG